MRQELLVVFMCLLGVGLTACVSKRQYVSMETSLSQQLDAEQQKRQATEAKLREVENTAQQYRSQLADLQSAHRHLQSQAATLERQNRELTDTLERLTTQTTTLQTEVEKSETLLDLEKKIAQQLQEQIAAKNVRIEAIEGKLRVSFVDTILFPSGSAQISAEGQQTLQSVASTLREDTQHEIMVQGHADNVPIGLTLQQRYATNWELSTARATAVVRFLQDRGDLDPQRLSASGFSYYRPLASNDTEEGRRQNRRIDIILVPIR
jgi:chemotaxis protein MotB